MSTYINLKLKTADSWLRNPIFRLLAPGSGLPTQGFRLWTSHFQFPGVVLLCLLLQVLSTGTSQSQSLEDYLVIAAENNPEVKAYFNDYLASVEKTSQVGALPDPELTIGFFVQPMERFMGKQQADIQLMQMFPWFGMLRTRKDEAGKMALAKYEIFEDVKNQLFFQVKKSWYEIYMLEEEISILEENLEILKTYERLSLIRFQNAGTGTTPEKMQNSSTGTAASSSAMSGMGNSGNTGNASGSSKTAASSSSGSSLGSMGASNSGMSDVLRIRIRQQQMESDLAFLKDSRVPLRIAFNQLLSRDPEAEVVVADSLSGVDLSLERLQFLDSITQNNPMLKMFDAEEQVYEAQERMASLEGRPMFGVGLNYMPFVPRNEDGMSMGGNDMVMPMVSLSIPIYRKKYNAMTKEAEFNKKAVQLRKENTVNQLTVQWSNVFLELDDAVRKAQLYKEQTALVRQTLSLLMTSYSTGGGSFEDILQVQQLLLDYQLKLINAIVKQHTSIAKLEMLAATELD